MTAEIDGLECDGASATVGGYNQKSCKSGVKRSNSLMTSKDS